MADDAAEVHHLHGDDDEDPTIEEELFDLLEEERLAGAQMECDLGPIIGPIPAIPVRVRMVRGMTVTVGITATVTYSND